MNAERLLHYYQQIADAPDAVAQLRRFILELAVRGKLVPQDPTDEPAHVLLERIAEEKAQFIQINGMRKDKPLPELMEDEIPFPIPQNWMWTRIRTITSDRGQRIPDSTFSYIDVSAIDKENGRIGQVTILESEDAPSRARKVVQKGDLIYSCVRPYLLNVAIIHDDINPPPIASTAFAVLNGFALTLAKYQWIVLRSPFMVAEVETKMRGQAYPAINDADFALLPFPLPPLAEQKRIVERVDQLMALCDQLEAARADREQLRSQFSAATLARLNQPAEDQTAFRADAGFALQHIATLSATPTQIKALRQTILNLAVRGKLVPQDPNDEPAHVLLERIAEEKAAKSPKSRQSKLNITGINEELPFSLPEGWRWCYFEEVANICSNLVNPQDYGDFPHIAPDNIEGWTGKILPYTTIREAGVFSAKHYFYQGMLLYSKIRPNLAKVTKVDFEGLCSADMYPIQPLIFRDYLLTYMITEAFVNQTVKEANRVAMPKINQAALSVILVPLPPLAEQKRIVERVDQLMALCDQLEASLQQAERVQHQLLKAVLQSALEPSLDEAEVEVSA